MDKIMSKNYLTSNQYILNEARDYLDGLMLGDGNILCENKRTGYYSQICKEKKWINKINEDLYEYGIESKVDDGRLYTGGFSAKDGSIAYHIYTYRYIEFKEMHDRFYVKWYDIDKYKEHYWHKDDGGEYFIWKKIVPKDINLSPICLANEYLGDGGISNQKYRHIYLSTDGFLRDDTIYLAELLSEALDIKCGVDGAGKVFISIRSDICTFLNYIKDCDIPECYKYKFPEGAMQ